MDRVERCSTKHFVRVISDKMIANRIHVAADGSGQPSFLKALNLKDFLCRIGVEFEVGLEVG